MDKRRYLADNADYIRRYSPIDADKKDYQRISARIRVINPRYPRLSVIHQCFIGEPMI